MHYQCLLQDHIAYSYEAPAYIDSDSQSSSSQYQEYHDSPSPFSDRGGRMNRESLPLAPLSGYTYTLYTYMLFGFTYIYISMRSLSSRKCTDILLPPWQERGRSGCSSSCSRCSRRHRCEAASGGCSRPPERSSFPRKTRST